MQITNRSLTVCNYFTDFVFSPLSEELTTKDKVIAFATTFFASLLTGGLFLLAIGCYQLCRAKPLKIIAITPDVPAITEKTYTLKNEKGEEITLNIKTPLTLSKFQQAIADQLHLADQDHSTIQINVEINGEITSLEAFLTQEDGENLLSKATIRYTIPEEDRLTDSSFFTPDGQDEIILSLANGNNLDINITGLGKEEVLQLIGHTIKEEYAKELSDVRIMVDVDIDDIQTNIHLTELLNRPNGIALLIAARSIRIIEK